MGKVGIFEEESRDKNLNTKYQSPNNDISQIMSYWFLVFLVI